MPTSSKYGPEVYELCLELYETKALSHAKIAQHLFDEGLVDKVVNRATILRWIDKAVGNTEKARTRRQRVEENLAAADLDKGRQFIYELFDEASGTEVDVETIEAKLKVLQGLLALRKERSNTYGTYAPKRKEVAVTTDAGDVHPRDLNPKGEKVIADFEAFLAHGNGARNAQDPDPS